MKRYKLKLGAQTLRHLTAAHLASAMGGGRTGGSVVINDCALQCTQGCNQCSMYPECGSDSSSTTF